VRSFTRRQALVGAGLAAGGGVGLWGRFAFGDSFEGHVGVVLGLETAVARGLLETMREEMGPDYEVRAAGFLFATRSPSRYVMPRAAREEAVEAFIGPLFNISEGYVMPYVYSGVMQVQSFQPCSVLGRS